MIEYGAIDWVVATGANVFHDLHYAIGMPLHQGDFKVNDCALLKKNIDRIYDIFLTEETMLRTDIWMIEALSVAKGKKLGTAQLHNILGKALLEDGFDYRKSMVAAAAKFGVPIYTSSPGDSEVGMDLAYARMAGIEIDLDPIQDVIETAAIVYGLQKNGVVIVGGGSPKNFYLQTQPMLRTQFNISKHGHDYDIQITIDSPHWGGLSGATPDEAVSWGKIKPAQLQTSVVVYSDATIALPILFGYVLETMPKRKSKRLFDKTPEFVARLKKELKTDVLGF
jgi:deoxyhypusine synthase